MIVSFMNVTTVYARQGFLPRDAKDSKPMTVPTIEKLAPLNTLCTLGAHDYFGPGYVDLLGVNLTDESYKPYGRRMGKHSR